MKKAKPKQMQFSYNGKIYPYELYLGGVKRFNLRIRPDGSMRLSVPRYATSREIESFLLTCAPKIEQAVARATKNTEKWIDHEQIRDGGYVHLFGERICLHIKAATHGQRKRAVCQEDDQTNPRNLTVFVTSAASRQNIGACILDWKKQRLYAYIAAYHREHIIPMFARVLPNPGHGRAAFVQSPKSISIRDMRSRWGSCNSQKGTLTFSLQLTLTTKRFVEYVIVHEFAHFLQPDHSPAYRTLLSALMPDWRERKRHPFPTQDAAFPNQ